jgi:tetratricopeptide (TPR) repeat protein
MVLAASAQQPVLKGQDADVVRGVVSDARGNGVAGVVVRLTSSQGLVTQAVSNSAGVFVLSGINPGTYVLATQNFGLRSQSLTLHVPVSNRQPIRLTLQNSSAVAPSAMQYSDTPDFTVAGVTDWTAVGGHGSDANLRTSETLARDTVALESPSINGVRPQPDPGKEAQLRAALAASPGSFAANHRLGEFYLDARLYRESLPLLESAWRIDPDNGANTYDLALACRGIGDLEQARAHVAALLGGHATAEDYRLAADMEEQSGNPLAAVRDDQKALALDPNEQDYFALGSELLLHRAIWQAQEVFRKGVAAWPKSLRLQTGFGAALFAGALYDEAALHLCAASDLDPTDAEPYFFMGKIETATPKPLPCIEQELARFVTQQPASSTANYLYATVLLKSQEHAPDARKVQRAESLLRKAVTSNAANANAWFELGNIASARHDYSAAIQDYRRAVDADPQLAEAHYRLAVTLERSGDSIQARQEFLLHDKIAQSQQEAANQDRKKIQQFVFSQSAPSAPPN